MTDDYDTNTAELPLEGELQAADALRAAESSRLKGIDHYIDLEYRGMDHALEQIRVRVAQAEHLMLDIGLLMFQIREHEGEEQLELALEQIDLSINRTYLRRWMSAAVKVYGANRTALTKVKGTKLLELVTLDDEVLDALNRGEPVNGIDLDDYAKMTHSALRDVCRKQRQEKKDLEEVHERIIERKDARINELEARLTRREVGSRDEQVEAKLADIDFAAAGAISAVDRLEAFVDELLTERDRDDLKPDQDERWRQALVRVCRRVDGFLNEYGGFEDPDGEADRVSDEWLAKVQAEQGAGQ